VFIILTITMAKAVFTAEQLESLMTRVLVSVMDKFDSCINKMLDKFEERMVKMNDDLSKANGRIDMLEQALKVRDEGVSYVAVAAGSPTTRNGQAASSAVIQQSTSVPSTRVGKRSAANSIKAIKPPLTCFVGRLDPKTTADDLTQYLDEVGIKDADCWKIQAKDGRVFKTSAFRVSCRDEFRELFYDENTWPEGAELRDWVYRRRDPTA